GREAAELTRAGDSALGRALPGLTGSLAFGVVYLVLAALFRSPELGSLASRLRRGRRSAS
ncbi:MAG TPA: hypothetical protein VFZ53_11615, partial [Polyangiaceae bacterium]